MDSIELLRQKAEQGDARAQNDLGSAYFTGQGVEQDYSEAVKWWTKAAEQGFAMAQYSLGLAYVNGTGIGKNYGRAMKWWQKAADQGNVQARQNLEKLSEAIRGLNQQRGGAGGSGAGPIAGSAGGGSSGITPAPAGNGASGPSSVHPYGNSGPSGGQSVFCEKCGAQMPSDSVFCPKCGTPVGGAAGGAGGSRDSARKARGCWIAVIIVGLVVIPLLVIGVLAAIALPAYSKYTARAKFTEVTTAAGPIKQQVELCFFDLGTLSGGYNQDTGATSCSDDQKGTGWNLERAVSEAQSKYVRVALVKNGVITMYSRNIKVGGQEVFTEILVPQISSDSSGGDTALSWSIAPESTCKDADLC